MAGHDSRLSTVGWKRLRLAVLDRDRHICQLCGGVATTVDHIAARADGGDMWNPANLRALCRKCNSAGGADIANLRREARYRTTVPWYTTRM